MSGTGNKAPVLKLASGTIKIAVWENEFTYEGKVKVAHQATIHRSFIDPKTRQWRDTNSIPAKDLLVAAELLREVYKTLQIRQLKTGGKAAAAADAPAEAEAETPPDEGAPPF